MLYCYLEWIESVLLYNSGRLYELTASHSFYNKFVLCAICGNIVVQRAVRTTSEVFPGMFTFANAESRTSNSIKKNKTDGNLTNKVYRCWISSKIFSPQSDFVIGYMARTNACRLHNFSRTIPRPTARINSMLIWKAAISERNQYGQA